MIFPWQVIFFKLANVIQRAVQRLAYLSQYIHCDILTTVELTNRKRADIRLFHQVFLLHILVNQELPQFFIACFHFGTSLSKWK